MKKFILIFVCFLSLQLFAQETVTLLVSSDGPSKEEAIKNALRSAIEQTYGAFVSSNTTILNDEMVKNDIITISSGNVTSFDIITSATLPNGRTVVTINATVSPSKLITYAQSKGAECQLSTSTYLMNLKLKKLNELNTRLAIANLFPQLKEMSRYMYDYELDTKIKDVDERKEIATIELTIRVLANSNTKVFVDFLRSSFKAIGERSNSTESVRLQYFDVNDGSFDRKSGKYIHNKFDATDWYSNYECIGCPQNSRTKVPEESFKVPLSKTQMNMLSVILDDAYYNFEVSDNMGNKYFIPIMHKIGQKYNTGLYINNFVSYDPNDIQEKLKKKINVSEEWFWLDHYEYSSRFVYKFDCLNIFYEFSVGEGKITIPYSQYTDLNKSQETTSRIIGERKVDISMPLETFANLSQLKIEACGNQYDNILERVCDITVENKHRYMNFLDLGLPSGTKWAKDDAYSAPISIALNNVYGTNIPTHTQFQELIDNCSFTWINDALGSYVKVVGPNGNEIKFDLFGIHDKSRIWDESTIGKSVLYWSRAFNTKSGEYYAFGFKIDMQTKQVKTILMQPDDPNLWHNIRLVL